MPRRGHSPPGGPAAPVSRPVPPGSPPQMKVKALRAGLRGQGRAQAGPPGPAAVAGQLRLAARASSTASPQLEMVLFFFSFIKARYGARAGPRRRGREG